jgi:hypothetical protein
MIIVLFVFTVWGASRIFSRENTSGAQAPSISDVLLDSATLTPTATSNPNNPNAALPTDVEVEPTIGFDSAAETATPTETGQVDAAQGVQITISVLERTFVRVTVDGVVEMDGRVLPGFAQTFNGDQTIEVLTGSGSAIQIVFNQNDMGVMGNLGQVVNLIYTLTGVQTPTMTPSPTPTFTPPNQKSPTSTRTLTLTPTPSLTRTPSLTPTLKP